jgi:nucleoside-diphosphate-sugar epimerase
MRVLVIGGTGHIGTYLVPQLVEAGHDVVSVSRGRREPYTPNPAWARVERVHLDRADEESRGTFGRAIERTAAEVVVDLTCYTVESATQLAAALRGRAALFLHCGTIWVHGPSVQVPTTEDEPRRPFGEYGCRKAAIERYLIEEAARGNLPAAVLHPGHLVGPGWAPINPAGNFNTQVFADLAEARDVALPNFGMETLHHVHAADVAQGFVRAIAHRDAAIGESFHVVSPAAVTLRGYAEHAAAWFDREPRLTFLPYDEWRRGVSERDAAVTLDHLRHSPNCSIEKARARLGYEPRYTSLAAVRESVMWLSKNSQWPVTG